MRSAALFPEILVLLPVVLLRPFVGVIPWSWISFMNPHRLVYGGVGGGSLSTRGRDVGQHLAARVPVNARATAPCAVAVMGSPNDRKA